MFGLPFLPGGFKLAILGALAALLMAAVLYHLHVVGERNEALAQVGAYQTAHETQKATISALEKALAEWEANAAEFKQTLENLVEAQKEANAHARKLDKVLSRHDLDTLAKAKPGLIERRINSGTADVFRMFESATGGGQDSGN